MYKDFRELNVSQRIRAYDKGIYGISITFPKFEEWELGSQLRRASSSVYLNLAEGNGQGYEKKEITHLSTCLGSLAEVKACLDLALGRSYIDQETHKSFDKKATEFINILYKLKSKLESKS